MLSKGIFAAHPPFLRREGEEQLDAISQVVERVVRSGRFLFGEELERFETNLAKSMESAHAVGVGSGTDAIQLALRALGVGPGDEVITQSHSSPFSVIAIKETGATPVLVDSSEDDFGMDVDALSAAITDRTRAVVPVHLYGHPVRIQEIVEVAGRAGLAVVEDCAQSQGALVAGRPVGTFGTAGAFSFYPTKNLASLGDGGAVVTSEASLAERVRRLRNGGLVAHGLHSESGITSRLSEIQAAVLDLRLSGLEAANEMRRAHANGYARSVSGVVLPGSRDDCVWAPHQYVVRHERRDELRDALALDGVRLLVHYALPIHLQEGFRTSEHPPGSLPVAEKLAREVLSLPTHPNMTREERDSLAGRVSLTVDHLDHPPS